jgi:hypothetical protein
VLESLPVLLLVMYLLRLVLRSLLQLFLDLLRCLHLHCLPLILKKRNSVLGNKSFSSRKRIASHAHAALKKKKERKKRGGCVKRLLVGRENRRRQRGR